MNAWQDCLLQCQFQQLRAEEIPISGPVTCEKANALAATFDVEDFDASTGWLHKFKIRYSIGSKRVYGERKSVDVNTEREWKKPI